MLQRGFVVSPLSDWVENGIYSLSFGKGLHGLSICNAFLSFDNSSFSNLLFQIILPSGADSPPPADTQTQGTRGRLFPVEKKSAPIAARGGLW